MPVAKGSERQSKHITATFEEIDGSQKPEKIAQVGGAAPKFAVPDEENRAEDEVGGAAAGGNGPHGPSGKAGVVGFDVSVRNLEHFCADKKCGQTMADRFVDESGQQIDGDSYRRDS